MSDLTALKTEIEEYLDIIIANFSEFKVGLDIYMENGISEEAEKRFQKVHDTEEQADTLRRGMIKRLLKGSFLSTTREEFMSIIEMTDKIANKTQSIIGNIMIKEGIQDGINRFMIKNIISITESQIARLKQALTELFNDYDRAFEIAHSLEIQEREVDTLAGVFIKEIMESNIELVKKMYYRDFVNQIAKISDIVEDIGDEIEKICVIRRV